MSITKQCTKCGEEKALDAFHANRSRKDGKCHICKTCTREYQRMNREKIAVCKRKYYEENKQRIVVQKRKYYQENKKSITARKRKHYEENKAQIAEYKRGHYKENKERISERTRKYRQENPEVGRRKNRKRRALKRNLPHQPLTPQQYEILHRQKYEIFGGNASGN